MPGSIKVNQPPPKAPVDFKISTENENIKNISNVLVVMSGKGGVGKSTVSANLAVELSERGFQVGLVDADGLFPTMYLQGYDSSINITLSDGFSFDNSTARFAETVDFPTPPFPLITTSTLLMFLMFSFSVLILKSTGAFGGG